MYGGTQKGLFLWYFRRLEGADFSNIGAMLMYHRGGAAALCQSAMPQRGAAHVEQTGSTKQDFHPKNGTIDSSSSFLINGNIDM